MGLMSSALHIGRNALLSYESALQVVGSNISSAGSPDYTRLTPELAPLQGVGGDGPQSGAGVVLSGIQRNLDEGLENRLRMAIASSAGAREERDVMSQVETFFDGSNETGVIPRMNAFFNRFDDLRNGPDNASTQELVLQSGRALADSFQTLRSSLVRLAGDLDDRIDAIVADADGLASQIADLNVRITAAEAKERGPASGLRDQRDAALRKLGEIADVTVRRQSDGVVNVYLGSEALVQGGSSRGLAVESSIQNGVKKSFVIFKDSGVSVRPRNGKLAGLIRARDEHILSRLDHIDEAAAALIKEVNRMHADSQSFDPLTAMIGAASVGRPDAALNSAAANLPFPPRSGSFYLVVNGQSEKTTKAYRIDVHLEGDPEDTTLASLVDQINGKVEGVAAEATVDGRLKLTAEHGLSFSFGNDGHAAQLDSSGVLAALGVNTFFTGQDASDVAVKNDLTPQAIAASAVFLEDVQVPTGEDRNIQSSVADVLTAPSDLLGGRSLQDGWSVLAADVAVTAAATSSGVEAASAVFSALQAQKESLSGVSLDEEAIELVRFERAFQGASRYVSAINGLIQEVINIAR